ncbi:MAG: hypothetical protein FJ275_05855 [Planctomycetes bacterium]|nr:hypothetical protein [Planctomycetota bacterium]
MVAVLTAVMTVTVAAGFAALAITLIIITRLVVIVVSFVPLQMLIGVVVALVCQERDHAHPGLDGRCQVDRRPCDGGRRRRRLRGGREGRQTQGQE